MAEAVKMKPIWYFVGLMLMGIGAVVLASGIYYLIYPTHAQTVLSELRPNLWWGAMMIVVGMIYFLANKNRPVE